MYFYNCIALQYIKNFKSTGQKFSGNLNKKKTN